jgi:RluA family pseudouridine synthase
MPEDIPLSILYEDADLVVIDKPAGMVVHPAAGHASGTLVNAILHHFGALPGEAERPGIVHRLDSLTSGVMVVAKSAPARDALVRMFAAHTMERAYVAIALGSPPDSITFDTQYGRHPVDRKRFSSKVAEGKRAVTHVKVIERLRGATLVQCTLETGRTHQIRVHMSDHGYPLLGDPVWKTNQRSDRTRGRRRARAPSAARRGARLPAPDHAQSAAVRDGSARRLRARARVAQGDLTRRQTPYSPASTRFGVAPASASAHTNSSPQSGRPGPQRRWQYVPSSNVKHVRPRSQSSGDAHSRPTGPSPAGRQYVLTRSAFTSQLSASPHSSSSRPGVQPSSHTPVPSTR